MSRTLIVLGKGGSLEVTPAGSGTFDITITNGGRSTEYTEAFDTSVAVTIANFISSHASNIADEWGILVEDGTTTLDLFGLDGAVITSDTATVGSTTVTTEIAFAVETVVSTAVAGANSLTINLNTGGSGSGDVVTATFLDAAGLEKFQTVTMRQAITSSGKDGNGLFKPSVANKGAIA